MTIGFHMLGDQGLHTSYAVSTAAKVKARYHVVLNNPDMARQVAAVPGTTVIYRRWMRDHGTNNGDDSAHLVYDPQDFVQRLHNDAPPGCLLYLGNEPDTGDLARLNTWTIAALDACERLGRKGVIFNFATGNPEPGDWALLAGAVTKARDGRHVLGLHEYFDNAIRKDFPWHVGRYTQLLGTFQTLPELVITEFAHVEGFDPHKGWRAVGMTLEKYADELRQAVALYTASGIHVCLFALVPEDVRPWGTFAPNNALIDVIAALNAPPVVVPPPAPPGTRPANAGVGVAATLQTTTTINLREAPGTDAAIRQAVRGGTALKHFPATERTSGGKAWRWVEVGADGGWMARVHPTWVQQFVPVDVVVPPPVIPPATDYRALYEAELARSQQRERDVRTNLHAQAAKARAVAALLEEIALSLESTAETL